MSLGTLPGSQASFYHQARKSILEPSSHHLSLNKITHDLFPNPSFSLKSKIGSSFRRRPRHATVKSLYAPAGSFYDLLGISETGSLSEIKQAYKQLVRKYHPDVSPPERVEEHTNRFIQVQEAYETLSDPKARDSYDRNMNNDLHLAFSLGRRFQHKEDLDEQREWKSTWQAQLAELHRRSMNKQKSEENKSWAARIRMQQQAKA